eukprot:5044016-Amphidinium_carterae.1
MRPLDARPLASSGQYILSETLRPFCHAAAQRDEELTWGMAANLCASPAADLCELETEDLLPPLPNPK